MRGLAENSFHSKVRNCHRIAIDGNLFATDGDLSTIDGNLSAIAGYLG